MSSSTRILLGLTLLLAAGPAVGDGVDHYELAPSVMRANGQPIYPAGVSDPSLANPPGPPPEGAIPTPPAPGLPVRTTPIGAPAGTAPMGPPVWSPSGPASPSNSAPGTANAGAWSSPAVMPAQVYPSATVVPDAGPPAQASWYTRVEYFHWNERIGGTDFVNENGTLFTLGYSRRIGIERFRAELFGGDVHYDGYDQDNMASMASNTGYLGVRGEYEMVIEPAAWEGRLAVLAGLGTRFWIRDLHDGSDDQGNPVYGYQETWWSMYPFLGLETHRLLGTDWELYSQSRVGATLLTYQFVSINDRPLWPRPGIFANMEIGLRGPRYFVAGRAEVMSWSPSSVVEGSYQPNSIMYTAGGRLGFMF
ncbi:MAG: hypothetical protein ACLP9L_37850 [Thermoguttaceae bacterium]